MFNLYSASKIGISRVYTPDLASPDPTFTTVRFNLASDFGLGVTRPFPTLFVIQRVAGTVRLLQGASGVGNATVGNTDMFLLDAGVYWPISIESISDGFLAIGGGSSPSILITPVSTVL